MSPGKTVRAAALKYSSRIMNKPQVSGWTISGLSNGDPQTPSGASIYVLLAAAIFVNYL